MISPCVPPFAHATFLETPSLEETVEAAVDLACETGEATILYRGDGTPLSPEEIVDQVSDGFPF
jgi:hypothetical protein